MLFIQEFLVNIHIRYLQHTDHKHILKNLLGPLIVYGRVIHDECVTDYNCSACSTYTTSQPLVLEDVDNVLPK